MLRTVPRLRISNIGQCHEGSRDHQSTRSRRSKTICKLRANEWNRQHPDGSSTLWTEIYLEGGSTAPFGSTFDDVSEDHGRIYIVVNDMLGGNFGSSANKTIECGLYNTSYNVDFAFNNGQPNLTIIIATRLNGVASHAALAMCDPKTTGSPNDASVCSPEAVAYIAVLNALGHMLLGFLEQSHYGHISCF